MRQRVMRTGLVMTSALAVVLAGAAVAARQGSAPAIPGKPGLAAGAVQAGATKITLAHAYASGPLGEDDPIYQIVLTDTPLPTNAIAKELERGGQSLLRSGKVSGVALLVDASGFVRSMAPFVGSDLRGSQMLASVGQLAAFAVKDGRVTGQGALTTGQTMSQGWSYAASWNATLRPPAK